MEYEKMAAVYDTFMKDAPYDEWFEFFQDICKQHHMQLEEMYVADLGCGTGEMTHRLADQAKFVYGVDLSEQMLIQAQSKLDNGVKNIQWLQQDIAQLSGLHNLDAVGAFFDVLNYLIDLETIERCFQSVYDALADKGLFVFDVHSINQVETAYVDETFAVVYDDLSYIWFCERGDHKGEMYHDLTFFLKNGSMYDRFDEVHHQRTYEIEQFIELLTAVGFKNVKWYSEPTIKSKNTNKNAARIFFTAQK